MPKFRIKTEEGKSKKVGYDAALEAAKKRHGKPEFRSQALVQRVSPPSDLLKKLNEKSEQSKEQSTVLLFATR